MSFGFGQSQPAFGGFGQSQPAFGAPASSPFGGSGFGAQTPAFGASTGGGFGASQPAFGAASTPAFGAAPAFGAGSTGFGARPATGSFGFGTPAPAASPFGASAPAFGAASTPAFGATSAPAFGGGAFGASAPAFGAASAPAFGAASTPAFGAPASSPFGMSTPAFGAPASTPAFGGFGAASTPAFGAPASSPAFGAGGGAFGGGFGAASPGGSTQGTRVVPYQKHQDKDQSGGTATGGPVYYNTITAMPQYQAKSVEELRWEDYQAGVKNASAAPAPAAAGGFGAPASSAAFGGFGASATPAFGAASQPAANPFGAPAASPFGGGFGAASTPAFGAPAASSPFGATPGGFGAPASTPSFGGFGAASTPAFGAASSGSLFGGAPSSGGFSFGGSSSPGFGAPASTPGFGAPASTPSFGGFGASPASSPFGASPAPAASPFGTPSPSPFGASPTPAFGASPSSSPFGGFGAAPAASSGSSFGFGSSFGAKPASTPGFGFGASSTPAFGASTPAANTFSFSNPSTGGFGASFGAAPASAPAFSFSQAPAAQPAAGGFNFGNFGSSFGAPAAAAAAQPAAPAAAPPGVGQSPYGQLSPLPSVNVPEPKVGISARPSRQAITTMRPSPLLMLRSTTPRFGAGPAARSAGSPGPSPAALALGGASGAAASPAAALLPARENPHRLFIREPPPSTSASPSRSSLTPSTPLTGGAGAAAGGGGGAMPSPAAAAAPARPYSAERPSTGGGAMADGKAGADASSPANGAVPPSDLLPRLGALGRAGYSMEPSHSRMQAMLSSDPDALTALEGFSITRRGVGVLRWLVPVDVRGLELDAIVRIDPGEVAVYTECPKPPEGSELNAPCEVTLLEVHKKKGGQVVTDPASVAAFEKRLRRYCAEAGAEFVAYKPDGGVWRFRVEHFSRYGVPLDEEEEDGDEIQADVGEDGAGDMDLGACGEGGGGQGGGKGRRFGAPALGGDSDVDEGTVDGGGSDGGGAGGGAEGGEDDDAMADGGGDDGGAALGAATSGGGGGVEGGYYSGAATRKRGGAARLAWGGDTDMDDGDGGGGGGGSEPLQHSLPALLSLPPGQLAAMRDSFFRRGGAVAADAVSAEAALAAALPGEPVALYQQQAVGQQARSAAQQPPQQPQGQRGGAAAAHNWARPRPALLQDAAEGRQQQQLEPAALVVPLPSAARVAAAAARAGPLVPPPAPAAAAGNVGAGNVCDAFMLMGRSFRAGFGPGGLLAAPVNALGAVGTTAPGVSVSRVSPAASVRPAAAAPVALDARPAGAPAGRGRAGEAAALKRRTLAAFEAHLAMSQPAGDGGDGADEDEVAPEGGGARRWQLVCSRRQLPQLVGQQLAALGRRGEGDSQGAAAELWALVQVLFEAIPGEEGGDEGDEGEGGEGEGVDGGGGAGDDAMSLGGSEAGGRLSLAGSSANASRLAAFKRRAMLSGWLASKAGRATREAVEAAASGGGRDAALWALLHMAAGHQLGPAAALAAAAGDARLAVLLSTAGRHGAISADITRQLQVWHSAGLWRDHFAQPRKLLFAVLSGRMGEAAAALQLDWARALGLSLWYATPPTEGLGAALAAYEVTLEGPGRVAGVAPPVPAHAADPAAALPGGAPGSYVPAGGPSPVASDAQYELLLLAARGVNGGGPGFAARLLRAAGRGTNPLDAAPGWVLASTLGALGELPVTDMAGEPETALLRLARDAVEQLALMASGRDAALAVCWAVYVVLHLPPALAPPAARAAAVRALLERSAPQWSVDARAHAVLGSTFGVPLEWLEAAQASWAGYLGDSAAQLTHLLGAGDAGAAHAVFCAQVAPRLFLDGGAGTARRLAALAERLAGAQGAIGPSWAAGGGVYHAWCRLFVAPGGGPAWRRDVAAEAVAAGEAAAAAEECCALAQQLAAARKELGAAAAPARRAVLARMADDVGAALGRLGAAGGALAGGTKVAAVAAALQQGCAALGHHQPVAIAGLAAQLAVL